MAETIIPGIPRIASFLEDQTMLTPFIGSLYAALHALGDPRPYGELLFLSGAGNRLCWLEGAWNGGNIDILNFDDPPFAPHLRALKALGLTADIRMLAGDGAVIAETAGREIAASIDAGVPVIAMGILGPPECCVVFGHQNDGETLIGWNYYQEEEGQDPMNPFRAINWASRMIGYLLLKKQGNPPSERESAIAAFRSIVETAHRGKLRGMQVGLSAWNAMLHQLEGDSFDGLELLLPVNQPETLWPDAAWDKSVQGRFFIYCDALCQVQERNTILPTLESLRDRYPEWSKPLQEAIDAWRECSAYGGFLWKYVSMNEEGYRKFTDADIRKILADEGRRSRDSDERAVGAIERLLAQEDAR